MTAHAKDKNNECDNENKPCDNDSNKLKAHVAVGEASLIGTHVVFHLV